MKGIIQSQIYQLKRDGILWGMFFGMVLLMLLHLLDYILFEEAELSGGYFALNIEHMNSYSVIFLVAVAAYVMGQDFLNKTAHYDIVSGCSRKAVFWGRVIPTILVMVVMSMVLVLLIPFVATIVYGWGTKIVFSEFLFRCELYIFLVVRMCCEVIFLTVVCRELYQVYIIEIVLYVLGIVVDAMNAKNPYVFVFTATREVFAFRSWSTYHINGTVEIMYENVLDESTVIALVLSSVGVSILYLLLGRHYFVIKDMD